MLPENYVSFHSLANNNIGDEGLSILVSVLKECQELKELKYEMDHCIYLIVTYQEL